MKDASSTEKAFARQRAHNANSGVLGSTMKVWTILIRCTCGPIRASGLGPVNGPEVIPSGRPGTALRDGLVFDQSDIGHGGHREI